MNKTFCLFILVAIFFITAGCSNANKPSIADSNSLVMPELVQHDLTNIKYHKDLIKSVSISRSSKDITFEMQEIYSDIKTLIISFKLSNFNKAKLSQLDHYECFLYRGFNNISGSVLEIVPYDGSYYGILKMELRDKLPVKSNLYLVIKGESRRYRFDFPVDFTKANEQTRVIDLNESFDVEDKILTIQNITFTPVQIVVDAKLVNNSDNNEYFLTYDLFDENENIIIGNRYHQLKLDKKNRTGYSEVRHQVNLPETYNDGIKLVIQNKKQPVATLYPLKEPLKNCDVNTDPTISPKQTVALNEPTAEIKVTQTPEPTITITVEPTPTPSLSPYEAKLMQIREIAYNWQLTALDHSEYDKIINWETAIVEEIDSFPQHIVTSHVNNRAVTVDITGKSVYRVIFRTTSDGILGPLRIYIEKSDNSVLGFDLRL